MPTQPRATPNPHRVPRASPNINMADFNKPAKFEGEVSIALVALARVEQLAL